MRYGIFLSQSSYFRKKIRKKLKHSCNSIKYHIKSKTLDNMLLKLKG